MDADEIKQCFKHFPKNLTYGPEIHGFAKEEVFLNSRYLFTSREKSKQNAYCTYCGGYFRDTRLKHNDRESCPECGSVCTVKASGRGRKTLIDEAYFVYYQKSLTNPKVITARGIYAVRDYRKDYHNVKTQMIDLALYIFEAGKSVMLNRYGGYYWSQSMMSANECWQKTSSVFSLFSKFGGNDGWFSRKNMTYVGVCQESIDTAVEKTQFEYSTYESYDHQDMVKFFDMYSRYPCIEYLTKLGMEELVQAKLQGKRTYGAINWRGTSLEKVLRLPKSDVKGLVKNEEVVDPLFLKLLQISKKDGSNLSFEEINDIRNDYGYDLSHIQELLKHTTLKRVDAYINKQYKKKNPKNKHYSTRYMVLADWKDYINDCITLELNLDRDSVFFPSNLYRAHQNTIKQIKAKADAALDAKIAQKAKELRKYCYGTEALTIRPAASTRELIAEGKALHHCVGTYAKRYADGDCIILFVRRTSQPKKPFFTIEVRKDSVTKAMRITQTRGKKNCLPPEDVKAFVEQFTEQKLNNKGQGKDRFSVPA